MRHCSLLCCCAWLWQAATERFMRAAKAVFRKVKPKMEPGRLRAPMPWRGRGRRYRTARHAGGAADGQYDQYAAGRGRALRRVHDGKFLPHAGSLHGRRNHSPRKGRVGRPDLPQGCEIRVVETGGRQSGISGNRVFHLRRYGAELYVHRGWPRVRGTVWCSAIRSPARGACRARSTWRA